MENKEFIPMDYYVDANAAVCGAGSADAPFATLDEAYAALSPLMKAVKEPTEFIIHLVKEPTEFIIHLASGVHTAQNTWQMNAEDYPCDKLALRFYGEEAESTAITSCIPLENERFERVEGKPYYRYQMEKDASGAYPQFRFLYANGSVVTRAHRGAIRAANCDQHITKFWRQYRNGIDDLNTELPVVRDTVPLAPKMYLEAELFGDITSEDYGRLEVHLEVQWKFNLMQVERIDWEDTLEEGKYVAVYFREDQYFRMQGPARELYSNRPYWLENSLKFLTEPGTDYYDRREGVLYYYPEEGSDMAEIAFEIPTLERFFVLNGMKNVTFCDLTLTGLDHRHADDNGYLAGQAGGESKFGWLKYAAIVVHDGEGIRIERCIFDHICGDGINMRGRLRDITVDSNRFFHIGATSIRIGVYGITKWSEENSIVDLAIENNYINGNAWFLRESNALLVSQAVNVQILYNTIKNCSYTAMSIGVQAGLAKFTHEDDVYNLKNVEIAHNYITDFLTDMRDGAAIYTLGGNAEIEYHEYLNYIHDNYIVWSKITGDAQGEAHTTGLYNDNCSTHWHDYNNVQILNPNRYWQRMYFHYVQGGGVRTYNILAENNKYVYCSSKDREEQFPIIYRNISEEFFTYEKGTEYLVSADEIHDGIRSVISMAGSEFCPPDINDILDGDF